MLESIYFERRLKEIFFCQLNKGKMEISVIILNYFDFELTIRCIENLLNVQKKTDLKLQIIVVDNSGPETGQFLMKRFPTEIELVVNQKNLGFSVANNQGILRANHARILLLNNDAFPDADTLAKGIIFLEENKLFGAWAPALIGKDGNLQRSSGDLPTVRSLISEYIFFNKLKFFKKNQKQIGLEVQSVIMAFFLMNTSVIEKIGLLDEHYFFTSEDMDYCKRFYDAKISIAFDSKSTVLHFGSASQSKIEWVDQKYLHDGRILYFRKHGNHLLAYLIIKLGIGIRRIIKWTKLGLQQ